MFLTSISTVGEWLHNKTRYLQRTLPLCSSNQKPGGRRSHPLRAPAKEKKRKINSASRSGTHFTLQSYDLQNGEPNRTVITQSSNRLWAFTLYGEIESQEISGKERNSTFGAVLMQIWVNVLSHSISFTRRKS